MTEIESRVSESYLRFVVEKLESFRSSPLGFRVAGTPEERQATAFVASEMREIGLVDVVEEPVPVDAWRFRDAFVELVDGRRIQGASMGGVPETPRRGVTGELVAVTRGGRRELEGIDVRGKVVLVDWMDNGLWPFQFGLELSLRGAKALVVACGGGGPWFQAEGAIGTFDAMWHDGACSMITISKEDAAALAVQAGLKVRVVLRAPLTAGAEGANVVGVLPGASPAGPILIGGHHDGWFSGAFDDATGVAATLALARAFVDARARPAHPIVFVSHTAEEYGLAGSRYDWCVGAWHQITSAHLEWASEAAFYLNIEGSGLPFRLRADPPPELAVWTRRVLRQAARDGLLPYGFQLSVPSTHTEVWTFLAAGVPGINVSTFLDEWYRTSYHTQYDTSDHVDFGYLAQLARVHSRFLLGADALPDAILDFGARSRHLKRALGSVPVTPSKPRLELAAEALARAAGRRAFSPVARGLHGLDAHGTAAYPHAQTAADVVALEAALRALRAGRRTVAANQLAKVGVNALAADLSEAAFEREWRRTGPDAPRSAWARQGLPDPGPNLWRELASLRREPGARSPGPWLEESLERHLANARDGLDRRLARMAEALETPEGPRS